MSIFYNYIKSDLAIYCTECKCHIMLSNRVREEFLSKYGDIREEFPSFVLENVVRCPHCGYTDKEPNPRNAPSIGIYVNGDKVKLNLITFDTRIVYNSLIEKHVLVNNPLRDKLVFNKKTRRIFYITKPKGKDYTLEDVSYKPNSMTHLFSPVPVETLSELQRELGVDCDNNINAIMKTFKFGSKEKADTMLPIQSLFKGNKKIMIGPMETIMKKYKFQEATKSIKRLVGDNALFLMLWHYFCKDIKVDNAIKLIPSLAKVYLSKSRHDSYPINCNELNEFISKAPNETDIVRKLVRFFDKSLNYREKDDDNPFVTSSPYSDALKVITDIMRNVRSVEEDNSLDDSFNNSTIRTYIYKGDIVEIHEHSSLAQNLLKTDHKDLPHNIRWNKTVNDISFHSPKNEIELSTIGILMHICVGGYGSDIIRKETNVVYAVDKSGKPIACIEIENDLSVSQLKGFKNQYVYRYRDECLAYLQSIGCTVNEDTKDLLLDEIGRVDLSEFKIIHRATTPLEIPVFNRKEVRPMSLPDHEQYTAQATLPY